MHTKVHCDRLTFEPKNPGGKMTASAMLEEPELA